MTVNDEKEYKKHYAKLNEILAPFKDKFPDLYYTILLAKIEFNNSIYYMGISYDDKTDKIYIRINHEKLYTTKPDYLRYILFHELLHFKFKHFERAKYISNHNFANIVCDLEINSQLGRIDLPIWFPEDINLPEKQTLEYYYMALHDKFKDEDNDEIHEWFDNQNEKNEDEENKEDVEGEDKEGKKGKEGKDKKNKSKIKKYIIGKHNFDDKEKEKISKKISAKMEEIKNFVDRLTQFGSEANNSIRNFEKNIEAKKEWEKAITFFDKQIDYDVRFTFKRPSVHHTYPVIAPYTYRDKKFDVIIFIDTSGSITDLLLGKFLMAIKSGMNYYNISDMYTFDTELYPIQNWRTHIYKQDISKIELKGGGGTSFVPIFDFLHKHKNYDGVIILTDGEGEMPNFITMPKNISVLWVINNNYIPPQLNGVPRNNKIVKIIF